MHLKVTLAVAFVLACEFAFVIANLTCRKGGHDGQKLFAKDPNKLLQARGITLRCPCFAQPEHSPGCLKAGPVLCPPVEKDGYFAQPRLHITLLTVSWIYPVLCCALGHK